MSMRVTNRTQQSKMPLFMDSKYMLMVVQIQGEKKSSCAVFCCISQGGHRRKKEYKCIINANKKSRTNSKVWTE